MKKLIYGLIGRKLGHSFSVPIHQALGNKDYKLIELEPEDIPAFMAREDIGGLNVTIPYKRTVMDYCDIISPEAEEIGAINTVVRRGDRLYGYNTDKYGFCCLAKKANIDFKGKKVLVLGSGGASRTAQYCAKELGADKVIVISRSGEDNYGNIKNHADADIIVNTTPVGMYPDNFSSPVSLDIFPNCSGVIDVVYNPLRTKLIMDAEKRGINCIGGLLMLTAQAKEAEELFFDISIPDSFSEEYAFSLTRKSENIVLIGMPGSGKSSIGQILADISGREFFELDEMIEKAAGKPIPQIFKEGGEAAFRAIETEIIRSVAPKQGAIIITGGGAVTVPENYPLLHQNGRIYEIKRDLDSLDMEGRPLSTDIEALRVMQDKRRPMYEAFRDSYIENNTSPEDAAKLIWRDFNENSCN